MFRLSQALERSDQLIYADLDKDALTKMPPREKPICDEPTEYVGIDFNKKVPAQDFDQYNEDNENAVSDNIYQNFKK